MRISIDLDTERAVLPGTTAEIAGFRLKRQLLAGIEVQFVRRFAVVELPIDATGIFSIKRPGRYDEAPLTGAAAWVKTGTGASTYYTFVVPLVNDALDALFFVDGNLVNDVPVLTFMGEVTWRYDSRDRKTQTLEVVLENDVNRDADEIPPSPYIVHAHDSFWRSGAGAPDDSLGEDGDFYINTTIGAGYFDVYKRATGTYSLIGNILGADGDIGPDGLSAYQIAVALGFSGTEAEWLASLQGASGVSGLSFAGNFNIGFAYVPGDVVAYNPGGVGTNGAYVNTVACTGVVPTNEDNWVLLVLEGAPGPAGSSAYQIAVALGFGGTVAEWLASLIGPAGAPGSSEPISNGDPSAPEIVFDGLTGDVVMSG